MDFEMNFKLYLPKFLSSKILICCVFCLLVLKIALVGVYFNFPKNIFFADITKSALTNFVNQGRVAFGLKSLIENKKLDAAAELKAQDMLQKGYFSHQSPEGTTPWFWFKKAGYNYKYAGENLAIGFIDSKEVYNAWYNSNSHRENILNPNYKEIGTAVLNGFGENKTIIVVQLFGGVETKKANGFVLSESTELAELAKLTEAPDKINPYFKYLNLIIYGFIALIGSAFLANLFMNFKPQKKDLILRAFIILAILLFAGAMNRDIVAQIIPHRLVI